MEISLFLDLVLVIFLAITIGYAVVLNKRLGSLRRDRDMLEKMALNFHASTERAEQSISRLKKSGEELKNSIKKAETLRDDLVFLSERGGSTADRLEDAVRAARTEEGYHSVLKNETSRISSDKKRNNAALNQNKKFEMQKSNPTKQTPRKVRELSSSSEEISEAEKELLEALRSAN